MCIYTYIMHTNICMYVCIYLYIHSYKLLSLYTVTCMSVFWAEHLVFRNWLECFSLGKTISLSPSIPWVPVVLCLGLMLCRLLLSTLFSMSVVVLLQLLFRQSQCSLISWLNKCLFYISCCPRTDRLNVPFFPACWKFPSGYWHLYILLPGLT